MDGSDAKKAWEANRKEIAARTRQYGTDLSEISRMFQRVIMAGSDTQRAELKTILADTKLKLAQLLERIDNPKQ